MRALVGLLVVAAAVVEPGPEPTPAETFATECKAQGWLPHNAAGVAVFEHFEDIARARLAAMSDEDAAALMGRLGYVDKDRVDEICEAVTKFAETEMPKATAKAVGAAARGVLNGAPGTGTPTVRAVNADGRLRFVGVAAADGSD